MEMAVFLTLSLLSLPEPLMECLLVAAPLFAITLPFVTIRQCVITPLSGAPQSRDVLALLDTTVLSAAAPLSAFPAESLHAAAPPPAQCAVIQFAAALPSLATLAEFHLAAAAPQGNAV